MNVFVLGVGLLAISLVLVVSEHFWHSASAVMGNFTGKIGKSAGSIAVIAGVLAFGVYYLRIAFTWSKKNKITVSDTVAAFIQQNWSLLRKWHPFLGMAVVSLVVFHGYIMWLYRFRKVFGIYTGIPAAAAMVFFLGGTGVSLYFHRQSLKTRKVHKVAAAVACILVVIHLSVAG